MAFFKKMSKIVILPDLQKLVRVWCLLVRHQWKETMYKIYKLFLHRRLIIFLVLLYFGIPVGKIFACNVPVFRYALERWAAEFYELHIYYDQSLDANSQKLLNQLLNTVQSDSLINLIVKTKNITDSATPSFPQLPWIELYYPEMSGITGVLWSGPFTPENIKRILTSPARSMLAERLTGGEAAVWLFLESGNDEKDRTSESKLAENLAKLSQDLKIPETGYDVDGNLIESDDFQDYDVRFSMISLSRKNPQEEILVRMLLGSEEDLIYYDDPIAFPVFGRGRALYGLVGAGVNEKTIHHACQSIINWCSCEIKAMNPGVDLLLENDWSKPAGGKMVKNEPLPPLTGVSAFIENNTKNEKPTAEKQVQIQKSEQSLQPDSVKTAEMKYDSSQENTFHHDGENSTSPLMRNILLVFGLGFVFMIGVTFVLFQRKRKK